MKSTGIVRKVDDLGRITLPIELRRTLDIDIKDPVEIFMDGDSVILRKFQIKCSLCGDEENLNDYEGNKLCTSCIKKIKKL